MNNPGSEIQSTWVADVLTFWFEELSQKDWFVKSADTDNKIRERFSSLYEELDKVHVASLLGEAETALAAVLVLDQFPRNLFRGSAKSFATDSKALAISMATVAAGIDRAIPADRRVFLYLPYEHSENLDDQHRSVELISAIGDDGFTQYAVAHRSVIEKFGRFPHRNKVLGRASTPEEEAYLAQPGSGF